MSLTPAGEGDARGETEEMTMDDDTRQTASVVDGVGRLVAQVEQMTRERDAARATLDGLRTQITELHRAVASAKAVAAKHLGDAERYRVERNDARAVAERAQADASTTAGEVVRLRAALALSQESLAAAVRDERVTVVDEVARLTRERDAALAARDIAVRERELSRAEDRALLRTLEHQRDALVAASPDYAARVVMLDAAVREYVAASDAHERASRAGGTVEAYETSAARIVETTEALRALVSR